MENTQLKNKGTQQFAPATWLNKLLDFAQLKDAGVAIWKLPQDNIIHILCDLDGGSSIDEVNLDDLESGFILAPFLAGTQQNIHFKADIKGYFELEKEAKPNENVIEISWENITEDQEMEITQINISRQPHLKLKKYPQIESTRKEDYIKMVKEGIAAISREELYKIVPSKIKCIPIKEDLDIADAYLRACNKYEDAFVSLTFSPKTGLWMGASPETLIEDKKNEYFKTVALAGTQAKDEKSIANTAWTQKEIEEQAYVSRYIINCFKKIRLREYEEIGPKTIQAGNLLHLKTSYKVDTNTLNFPELASVMLKLLHPTSAVCGMPKVISLDFLKKHETHERSYFSGYLGPVHMDQKSNIFVNLRCCQFSQDKAIFYAGAGVTEDSEPEKEWQETEIKCNVLANIIFHD
ncbi:chorismate-binding protein [Marivirga sp. S37H4]|uniref:Chorismate-binding protein n=1 Tax=Marivirga aurantiaca TaxID=2802615 RepID=A0A934WW82_9BACT|nr:chorismate-binding protein [Marivirga aurantiaca]MBK6264124.1 chorismate-binding protein [Marivirga aurantiaca]